MQEKEAVVDIEDYGYDLPGVQTLLSQLEGVEVRGSVMKQWQKSINSKKKKRRLMLDLKSSQVPCSQASKR